MRSRQVVVANMVVGGRGGLLTEISIELETKAVVVVVVLRHQWRPNVGRLTRLAACPVTQQDCRMREQTMFR